jgi:hypothetical protein
MRSPIINRLDDLASEIANEEARIHDIVKKSLALLKEPPPDTFLGRRRYDPIPLPEPEW